jgi:hypothetical protein
MQRFVALVALVAAFLSPLAAEVTCAMGTLAMHCCCDQQNGLEALPDRPALQNEMTCCPRGECAISAAPTVGKGTDATPGTPSPSLVAVRTDAGPALETVASPWIERSAKGLTHDARGPPVPLFLLHRTLLV